MYHTTRRAWKNCSSAQHDVAPDAGAAAATDCNADGDPMESQQDEEGETDVVIGHARLLNHHNACLRASKEIFDRIATDVLDGDEGARFKHVMVEKIVGWKNTFSAEEDNSYHAEQSQSMPSGSTNSRSNGDTRSDHLYRKEILQDECIFAPIWRMNQRRLRTRCERVLQKLYNPLQQSLDKRIAVSSALAAARWKATWTDIRNKR